MSNIVKGPFVQDSWQNPRNARTFAAYMALQNREIGARIAELRRLRGNPPQEIVAHKLDVSNRAYQAWEAGDTKPSWRNLTKLAKFFGVEEEWILLGDEGPVQQREETQLDRIEAKLDAVIEQTGALTDADRELLREVEAVLNRLGRDVGKGQPLQRTGRRVQQANG